MSRAPGRSYAMMVTGFVLRSLFTLLIIGICALLFWRVFISARVPAAYKRLAPNEVLASAYRENGNTLTIFTQDQSTTTKAENNYGYFSVPRFVFIEEADQVQVVFRYNNSTLEAVKTDLALENDLPRGEEIFDVSLVKITDLTPEDTSDNTDGSAALSSQRLAPTGEPVIKTTALYTYFLYTFDGVEIASDTLVIFMDIYYGSTPDYGTPALGTLRLFHHETPRTPVELTSKEKRSLADYGA